MLNSVNINNLTDLDQPRPCSPEQLTHSIHITLHYIHYASTLTTNEACFIILTLLLLPKSDPLLASGPVCLALVLFQVPCCRSIPEHPHAIFYCLGFDSDALPYLTLP